MTSTYWRERPPRPPEKPWHRRLRDAEYFGIWAIVIGAIVGVLILAGIAFASYSHETTVYVKICSKEAVATGSTGHDYRVYTSNGTYVVKDHWIDGTRFNSADVYGRIQTGKDYALTVYGWRVGLFSMFQNIISGHEVPASKVTGTCSNGGNLGQ